MKIIFQLFLLLTSLSLFSQNYSFAKDFKKGKVLLKDSSAIEGQIKWFPHQNSNLKYRKDEKEKTIKYEVKDVLGFWVDDLKFVKLENLVVFADHYALLGKSTAIKEIFGEVISEGKYNIYLISITGSDPLNGIQNYFNFIFEKRGEKKQALFAYPYMIRMKDKKYENAKENLYFLFQDNPEITEKLKNYKKEDSFLEIIDMIKEIK